MRYRATILSLVAIAFVAVMILPALSVWILAAVSGIGEIWVLLAVGLLLFAIIFALLFVLPRFTSRR